MKTESKITLLKKAIEVIENSDAEHTIFSDIEVCLHNGLHRLDGCPPAISDTDIITEIGESIPDAAMFIRAIVDKWTMLLPEEYKVKPEHVHPSRKHHYQHLDLRQYNIDFLNKQIELLKTEGEVKPAPFPTFGPAKMAADTRFEVREGTYKHSKQAIDQVIEVIHAGDRFDREPVIKWLKELRDRISHKEDLDNYKRPYAQEAYDWEIKRQKAVDRLNAARVRVHECATAVKDAEQQFDKARHYVFQGHKHKLTHDEIMDLVKQSDPQPEPEPEHNLTPGQRIVHDSIERWHNCQVKT